MMLGRVAAARQRSVIAADMPSSQTRTTTRFMGRYLGPQSVRIGDADHSSLFFAFWACCFFLAGADAPAPVGRGG